MKPTKQHRQPQAESARVSVVLPTGVDVVVADEFQAALIALWPQPVVHEPSCSLKPPMIDNWGHSLRFAPHWRN